MSPHFTNCENENSKKIKNESSFEFSFENESSLSFGKWKTIALAPFENESSFDRSKASPRVKINESSFY
jgi:hypothetical protein